jgi:GH15 family glucan-1,4-alpha-glucosidase
VSCPIEDYALIGDTRGAGLVSKSGSIDWLCMPRFDSGACFAALLGTPEHGRWLITPRAAIKRITRRYQGDSLVLETLFETAVGEVALIDCMVFDMNTEHVQVVRVVEGRRGRVALHMELTVRFDYGSIVPWVTHEDHSWRFIAGPDTLRLHSDIPLHGRGLHTLGELEVCEGQRVSFLLEHHESHAGLPLSAAARPAQDALVATRASWHAWSSRSTYRGEYPEAVRRSLLVLKALTYGPTGGIVAAPTTSLPEQLAGERNWDYRFCWLRDATITLYALLVSGYQEEARAFRGWLMRAVAGSPAQVQVIYGIAGERRLPEVVLPWLPGYADSRPVRVGNAAHTQLQLDVIGELLDAMHQCRRQGLEDAESWSLERALLGFLEERWREPDEGIWEVRGPRRHFTYSKVMAWVAFDRGVKAIEQFGCKGPLERFRALRDEIHADVCQRGYCERKQTFTHWYGSEEADASLLLIPLVGFLPPSDPRVQGTLAAVERELLVDECFVVRYRTRQDVDGLPKGEGAFLACSFWLVSNYVMQGRHDQARALFERLLTLRNDVGLLAEEYDPDACRMLGNFPQAFSHLALVDAAQALSEGAHAPPEHRLAPEKCPSSAPPRGSHGT